MSETPSKSSSVNPESTSGNPNTGSIASRGYRKKPLWIYLTAIALMLSPIGNLLYSLATMKVPGWYKPSVWIYWGRFVTPSTWILLGLLFLAGASLLVVRRWSWTFSLAVLGFVAIYDLVNINHFMALGPLAVVAMIVGTVSFGLILYFSEFRKPYMNPRLRWWETSPRYIVELPVSLSGIFEPGTLVDVSRTGILVKWPENTTLPEGDSTGEITITSDLKLPVEVKRRTPHGLGLQFKDLSREQTQDLLNFIKTLSIDPTKIRR